MPSTKAEPPPTRTPRTAVSHCHAATAPPTKKRLPTVKLLPVKKRAEFPVENYGLPKELGEWIHRYVEFLKCVGWQHFFKT